MFNELGINSWWFGGNNLTPAPFFDVQWGFDPENYIATAQLAPVPYSTQSLIATKMGGLNQLINAVDDTKPPTGSLNPNNPPNNQAYVTYQNLIQQVTAEINGYLSSIYPCPLAQTGTVAVFQVLTVDSNGGVLTLQMIQSGNYQTAPTAVTNTNLITGSPNYSAGGIYSLAGLKIGVAYSFNTGANEAGTFINGSTTLTGSQTFVAAATSITINGTANQPVTANVFQATPNTAYLRHIDPQLNEQFWGQNWLQCQTGIGLQLTVNFSSVNYSDESGQILTASTVLGTPSVLNGGMGYQSNQLLVLTGGSSFVPAKVRQAFLDLFYYECYKRRLSPDEKNPGYPMAKFWRDFFVEIGEGTKELDGTYRRFFSAATAFNKVSVLYDANSL